MRSIVAVLVVVSASVASAAKPPGWWNPQWRFRTTAERPAPYRDGAMRPVEVAVDFARLLDRAGVDGAFDPDSLRVVQCDTDGMPREVPSVWRTEFNARLGCEQGYLTWFAKPRLGHGGAAEIYFDVKQAGLQPAHYDNNLLPPQNLLANPGFEEAVGESPAGWTFEPAALVRLDHFRQTTGERSLKITVDESTPAGVGRDVAVSQRVDVRRFAGQEVVFQCDLLAERAAYGAPVAIAIQQFRADGSRIREDAVDPRWLNIELAQGQLVQFCERGRFSPQAATANVLVRMRCSVRDADTGRTADGPEAYFTVWLDRVVLRPEERWPWPAETHGGFVTGALTDAPVNRGFEFTGLRRLAFNGASEATLTGGFDDPDPHSVHWGLEAGTLEFWCRPSWNADDDQEHAFFDVVAYGHRRQSRLRKLDADGKNRLEFTIADAGGTRRLVQAFAPFQAGQWHHVAATWDFPNAKLALFFDGKPLGATSSAGAAWPSSLVSKGTTSGIGIAEQDSRSLPMQAFIGGDADCQPELGAEAVLDEVRISDCARYIDGFEPPRHEFNIDGHTRALWHFENESHGSHDGDDGFVRGHLACELPRQQATTTLDVLTDDRVEYRTILVAPQPDDSQFAANRAENRLTVTRPFTQLPDPRFVEYRLRQTEHVIASADDEFTVSVAGDWEPLMESLSFELADVANRTTTAIPHWRANDNVVPFSVQDLAETLAPDVENDAERAFEVFQYALATTNYFDADYCETLPTRHRPRVSYTLIKALNIYPFDQCGPLNHTLRKLFLTAGISSQNAPGTHHQFEQAFYQGSWRLFDLSPRVYWLNRDNATVAGRRDFEDDLYLKLRQGSSVQSALRGRRESFGLSTAERPHSMEFPLRPGERVSFGWQNEGRWFELTEDRQPIPLGKVPPSFGNGTTDFRPTHGSEAVEVENLDVVQTTDGRQTLRSKDPQRAASLVYRLQCPYILSNARVRGEWTASQSGTMRASLSFDEGRTWTEIWRNPQNSGTLDLDLLPQVTARYAYWLRVEIEPGDATLCDLEVQTTFVVSPLSLPGTLTCGKNCIRIVGGPVQAPVKTICRWYERHKSDLGVDVNAISYYLDGDRSRRNVLIAAPGKDVAVEVTLTGRDSNGEIFLEHLPAGWTARPQRQVVKRAANQPPVRCEFLLRPASTSLPTPVGLEIVLHENGLDRRVPIQILVAPAALACDAEAGKTIEDAVVVQDSPTDSGGRIVEFNGAGQLAFDARAIETGEHALWLRARWEPGASTQLELAVDEGPLRRLSAAAMIGFTDWNDPRRAHTKMFAHYGEAYGHWSWYRIGDINLETGPHRLSLSARDGAEVDALILLPATPPCDRAAMNLFQNWNYDCRIVE